MCSTAHARGVRAEHRGLRNWLRRLPIILLGAAGCTVHPVGGTGAGPLATAIPAQTDVILLEPAVRFERIQSEGSVTGPGYDSDGVAASLRNGAQAAAAGLDARLVDCRGERSGELAALCSQLAQRAPSLAHGTLNDDAGGRLRTLAGIKPACAVLASSLLAEVGTEDSYSGTTGQMRSANSNSVLSAALIRCDPPGVLWKNTVLLRALPKVSDAGYTESVQLLYGGSKPSR